ncbi:MAG: murein hydrolase activator EnvC family protein [Desulfovibrionales bacterium]
MASAAHCFPPLGSGFFPILMVFALFTFGLPVSAQGQSKSDILKENIRQEQKRSEQQKAALQRLSRKERALYSNLAEIEDRMLDLENQVEGQQENLDRIRALKTELGREHDRLLREQDGARKTLEGLLLSLWPVHIAGLDSKLQSLSSWSDTDRKFTWLSSIYELIDRNLEELRANVDRIEANLAKQEQNRVRLLATMSSVETTKDALLKERLRFLAQVQEVRSRKLEGEEQLRSILDAIDALQYELTALTDRSFKGLKGYLPWPARGKIIVPFNTSAAPPHRGIGISLAGPSEVTAVSWGKVVHNDQLRGFGQVVILFHGDNYYTLYAFLSDSDLKIGQTVEKGEAIGTTGYYPQAKGPGLYFELRSGPKAVNPVDWLSSTG